MTTLCNRFLRYVRVDTQSCEDSASQPSTPGQLVLAEMLKKELQEIGLSNVRLSDKGYLMAELPANTDKNIPAIGFIAHMDTSPDVSGRNVRPRVFSNYNGGDLILDQPAGIVLRTDEYPELKQYIGRTIITSSGDTLLGADDKSGIAIIMTTLAEVIARPEIEHGKIVVAFTPDEEIGRGTDYFDVAGFGAEYAYTVDGGPLGELEIETFNAASATIKINGTNIHPGTAYGRMKNAILIAMELNAMLPADQRPENTTDYQGFYHLHKMNGTVEHATMAYLIRDHSRDEFNKKKALLESCVDALNAKYANAISLKIEDQYCNMREKIEPVSHIVDLAKQAMMDSGVEPVIKPIRGGTDGARLSFMGLPCPNLFTGGHNFHSRFEFVCLESMDAAMEVIIGIISVFAAQ